MMTRMTRAAKVSSVDLQLRLLTRGEAERVVRRRRKDRVDLPWAEGYPLDGDSRACASYVSHLPLSGGSAGHDAFGYYQIVGAGVVIGGIGFHGRPRQGVVEIGYGGRPVRPGTGGGDGGPAHDHRAGRPVRRRAAGGGAHDRGQPGLTASDAGGGDALRRARPEFLHYQLDLE